MDCSLPGSSVHGIFQARVLEWVAISFSRGSSQVRDRTQVSRIAGRCFTLWATREALTEHGSTPKNKTQFPLSQSLPSGSFLWVSSPFPSEGRQNENHNHGELISLITWNTALSNSMKLSHALWSHPRQTGHGGKVWQNVIHWRREWQTTSAFLPWEPMNSMKRQNDRILKEELPRPVGAQYATGDQ